MCVCARALDMWTAYIHITHYLYAWDRLMTINHMVFCLYFHLCNCCFFFAALSFSVNRLSSFVCIAWSHTIFFFLLCRTFSSPLGCYLMISLPFPSCLALFFCAFSQRHCSHVSHSVIPIFHIGTLPIRQWTHYDVWIPYCTQYSVANCEKVRSVLCVVLHGICC